MKLVQHCIALLAAILLGTASVYQARRALAKAEHERVSLTDETLRDSLRSNFDLRREVRESTAKVRRHEAPADQETASDEETPAAQETPGDPGFNVKHFRHVAFLWGVIVVGSALAAIAELIDLLIDL